MELPDPGVFAMLSQHTAPWTGGSVSCEDSLRDSVAKLCISLPGISPQDPRQLWTFDRRLKAADAGIIYRDTIYI